jgi:hypothetical protein
MEIRKQRPRRYHVVDPPVTRTERGQVGPCPTDEDHRPLSERVRGLAATLVPGLMQQRSLRHNLQVESFHLLCSDQLHCRPYFKVWRAACLSMAADRIVQRNFGFCMVLQNPFPMRDGCLRFPRASVAKAGLRISESIGKRCGGFAQADVPQFDLTAAVRGFPKTETQIISMTALWHVFC